jgi:hypothetical protein
MRASTLLAPFTGLFLATLLGGCADALPPGTRPGALPVSPSAPESLITFVRPTSTCDTGEWAVIVDARGRFVANVPTNSQVAYVTRPGIHTFYAWSNDDIQMEINRNLNPVAVVVVEATPGQSQYVAVQVTAPCSVRSNFEMRTVAGSGPAWQDLEGWLKKAQPMTVDRAVGQALLNEEPIHLARHLELGREKLRLLQATTDASREHLALLRETEARAD